MNLSGFSHAGLEMSQVGCLSDYQLISAGNHHNTLNNIGKIDMAVFQYIWLYVNTLGCMSIHRAVCQYIRLYANT